MRCRHCHGGTVLLPAEPGRLAFIALCQECRGSGHEPLRARPVADPDFAVLRKRCIARFPKTLRYLAEH